MHWALLLVTVHQHVFKHDLKRIVLVRIKSLRKVRHGKVKVVANQHILVLNILSCARLDTTVHRSFFESRIEDVQREFVADHISFDAKKNELSQVHCAILSVQID